MRITPSRFVVSSHREPGLIPRYSLPAMSLLFTDDARFTTWLEVEILATEGWAKLGVVPEADAVAVRTRAPAITADVVADIAAREAVTDHDVAAFVDVGRAAIGPPAWNWV